MANWKIWSILFLSAAVLAVLGQGALRQHPVDAGLLDALSLPAEDWMQEDPALAVLRWVGTPPEGNALRAAQWWPWILSVRDFLGLALILGALGALAHFFPALSRFLLVVALAALLGYGAWREVHRMTWMNGGDFIMRGTPDVADSLTEAMAQARLLSGDAPVWMNLTAARWWPLLDPTAPENNSPLSPEESLERMRQAGQPTAWRLADRASKYGAVVLAGPVAEYRPLLDHLLKSPDWSLAQWYPYALVFRRGANPPGHSLHMENEVLEEKIPGAPAQAVYWARLASQAAAVGQPGEARRLFQKALGLDAQGAEVRALQASFLASRGEWAAAAAAARALVAEHPRYLPAWQVLVQADLAGGRSSAAWEAAEAMLRLQPKDPYSLFLTARAAHEAGASFAEVEFLQRLIQVSRRRGLPVGHYYIYLGQAQAKQGYMSQAMESFQTARDSGELNEEALRGVQELLDEIQETPPAKEAP